MHGTKYVFYKFYIRVGRVLNMWLKHSKLILKDDRCILSQQEEEPEDKDKKLNAKNILKLYIGMIT